MEPENEVESPVEDMAAELSAELFPSVEKPEVIDEPEEQVASGEAKPAKSAAEPTSRALPSVESVPGADKVGDADPLATPPVSWGKDIAKAWTSLSPEIKKQIAKREEDVKVGFNQLNNLAQFGDNFRKAVEPLMPTLQRYGLEPARHAAELMQVHARLALGTPQQKVETFLGLMKQFGLTPDSLVDNAQAPYIDPQVQSLTTRFEQLQSTQQQLLSQQQTREIARITEEVNSFKSKNPHFDTVQDDIARLLETKACQTLQQAYDTAIWANPLVREQLLLEQSKATAELNKAAKDKRLAAARQSTSANVRSIPKSRGPTASKGSMEDTLRETANRLYADNS